MRGLTHTNQLIKLLRGPELTDLAAELELDQEVNRCIAEEFSDESRESIPLSPLAQRKQPKADDALYCPSKRTTSSRLSNPDDEPVQPP